MALPVAPARASDSEFAVFLAGCQGPEAIATAFRCIDALSLPYQEPGLSVDMSPAVGIALAPVHGNDADTLIRHASVALLTALSAEDPAVVYDPQADPHRPDRLSLMADLREAVDGDQLSLHYQPKLNLATGRVDGAEGLARWRHPVLGSVPPDQFIALAEETGNIRRVTRWALAAGSALARRWSTGVAPIRIAVNVSARDLGDEELPRRIADLLAAHRVAASSLLLEVTESAVMSRPEVAIRILRRLADLGIDLAIDDFGVGQSSFAYLRQLPVRELKIDRLFTRRIAEAAADRAIVRSIVELGHHLGYRVTAEGVEDQATLDFLVKVGCDHAQGYWISRPLPEPEFEAFIAGNALTSRPAGGRRSVARLARGRPGEVRGRRRSHRPARGPLAAASGMAGRGGPAGGLALAPERGRARGLAALPAGVALVLALVAARRQLLSAGLARERRHRLDLALDPFSLRDQ